MSVLNFSNKSFSYESNFNSRRELPISPSSEYSKYTKNLYQINLFPYVQEASKGDLTSIQLSFSFRSIDFSKKRALPFFLSLELLTQRKCVATVSQQNVQAWKLRKGRLVGCKVTLRQQGFFNFIDTLNLTLSRREKLQLPYRNKFQEVYSFFSKKKSMTNESANRGNESTFSKFQYTKFQPNFALTLGELVLFYPIEVGLGLHPDVQRVHLQFIFSSFTLEEQFFFLRILKIPYSVLYIMCL